MGKQREREGRIHISNSAETFLHKHIFKLALSFFILPLEFSAIYSLSLSSSPSRFIPFFLINFYPFLSENVSSLLSILVSLCSLYQKWIVEETTGCKQFIQITLHPLSQNVFSLIHNLSVTPSPSILTQSSRCVCVFSFPSFHES